jgi:hypothetical protein
MIATKLAPPLLVTAICAHVASTYTGSSDKCKGEPRITDERALSIAKAEMTQRSPTFNPTAIDFSVVEDDCDLLVHMDGKRSSRRSTLVLTRSGEVKLYWGPM